MEIALISAVSAFFGALFAFLVSQLNEKVKGNKERWFKHRNALIDFEYKLNSIMSLTCDNKYVLELAINSYATALAKDRTLVIWSEPQKITFDSSKIVLLLGIELINEVFSYGVKIRKHNNDVRMICHAYSEMRILFIKKEITEKQYSISLKEYCDNLKILIKAYNLIEDKTVELSARIRISQRKDRKSDKGLLGLFFTIPKSSQIDVEKVKKEIELILEEAKLIQSKSKNELDNYLGG